MLDFTLSLPALKLIWSVEQKESALEYGEVTKIIGLAARLK